MLKEIIKHFSKFSSKMNEWKGKWYGKYTDEHSRVTAFHKLWEIFGASVLATDDFVERIDDSIRKLETALRSIPEPDNEQRLEALITRAESDVSRITKELNELKTQINELNNKSTSLRRSDVQARQTTMQTLIEQKDESLEKAQLLFRVQQAELFEEGKKEEIQLCENLKSQSQAFIEALDINPKGFA
jgi:predicted RNase H-like nuclease (RuvC/YqgF family)